FAWRDLDRVLWSSIPQACEGSGPGGAGGSRGGHLTPPVLAACGEIASRPAGGSPRFQAVAVRGAKPVPWEAPLALTEEAELKPLEEMSVRRPANCAAPATATATSS